jgi:hypothetical protein
MNKICTNIDQSNKLIELGIDINSADMYWWSSGKRYYIEAMDDGDFNEKGGHVRAWSLSQLLSLIYIEYNLEKTLFDQSDIFTYSINCPLFNYRTFEHDEPLDAAFEMICYLLEQNKIKLK